MPRPELRVFDLHEKIFIFFASLFLEIQSKYELKSQKAVKGAAKLVGRTIWNDSPQQTVETPKRAKKNTCRFYETQSLCA